MNPPPPPPPPAGPVLPRALVQVHGLMGQGRLEQAHAALLRVLAKSPGDVDAMMTMCALSAKMGQRERALHYAERCVAAVPRDARAHMNRAGALVSLGRAGEAAASLIGALEGGAFEAGEQVYSMISHALVQAGEPARALEWTARGLETFPESAMLLLNDGAAALVCGEAARSVRSLRRAHRVDPGDPRVLSNLLSSLNYADLEVQREATETPAMYGRLVAERNGPAMFDWEVTPEPERALRIGVLSPDLRMHAVSYFIEPVLRGFDRAQWTVIAYSTASAEDQRSEELRGVVGAENWRRVHGMKFVDLAALIKQDRIDVLIDLAGHTTGHALGTLHLKPAPVQITWIGYPHSTGVPSVDWRIVDSITDPPPPAPWVCVEKPLRLDPCFVVWRPADGTAGAEARPPMEANGQVTFGSFASLQKLSEATVRMWAGVLKAVPGSRLLYKTSGLRSAGVREMVMKRLESAGLGAGRVMLEGPGADAREMAGHYARMDASLDTFPYHGTTTTCECLWMGVPMVTMEGPAGVPASRVSCSIIRAVCGEAEAAAMIAGTEDEFVSKAAALARDSARLRAWRSPGAEGLRARMAASAVRDEAGRCRQLEEAVRGCWRAWCEGRGARVFKR